MPYCERQPETHPDLRQLREAVRGVERRWEAGSSRVLIPTGWDSVDRYLAAAAPRLGDEVAECTSGFGLITGALHEWYGLSMYDEQRAHDPQKKGRPLTGWIPPLSILAHLGARSLVHPSHSRAGWIVWIGRRCWPYPKMLQDWDVLRRSLFIDPPHSEGRTARVSGGGSGDGGRLWAIDLCLRSPGVSAVIADGSGLSMAATRRLQLAVESGRALALLARPHWERHELTAATTRWLVGWESTPLGEPRWTVELLRCKGVQPVRRTSSHERCLWILEWDSDQSLVALPADVADRSGQTQAAANHLDTDPTLKTA